MRGRLPFLVWGPLLAIVIGIAVVWFALDRWWPTIPAGYGPRWPWWLLVPLPLFARRVAGRTRAAWVGVLALLVGVGLIGIRVPLLASSRPPASAVPLQVVAFNAGVRGSAAAEVAERSAARGADVIAVVECPRDVVMAPHDGYHRARLGEVCLWTRHPLAEPLRSMPRDPAVIGWSGTVVRGALDLNGQPLPFGVVHLRSVRNELSEFLDLSEVAAEADSMRERLRKRVDGSAAASAWLDDVPLVVGDFNLVPESPVFRRDWGQYRSAWGVAGLGAGYTWRSSWYGLRIDHVLVRDPIRVAAVAVGDGLTSDHAPITAHLRLHP